ncbi:DUF3027 domain-containing protein [Arthrobacter agilis]|uniref:DUF3027 domain-containing protein n=1 Tax=Arthrobacter agilis TaxID=37921 RepID=UPI00236709DA|nr:DUF3027 domain-containing protein [Arthrobacter agilis]WDF33843.1 DUF3027 domain-containing protein [Arthrobacter agilis]
MTQTSPETAHGEAPTGTGMLPTDDAALSEGSAPQRADPPKRPRAARRIPTSDSVLEGAVERAREAILEGAAEARVGRHVSAVIEGERLVTHRFEAFVPGYGGWQWYATVARVARSKEVTICEVGLLPSDAALLAPEWLPWSERVRPEDSQEDDAPSADAASSAERPGDDAPAESADPMDNADPTDPADPADNADPVADTADAGTDEAADTRSDGAEDHDAE